MYIRSLTLALTAALASMLAQPTAAAVVSTAYYVSPTGSDNNKGLSASAPFQTLEHAEAAMAKSQVKTTYLLGGVYRRTAPLRLGPNDAGEAWLAYPGQTAILDGGATTSIGIYLTGPNITIRWLNIRNYAAIGIYAQNTSGLTIDSNTIQSIYSTAWSEGAIMMAANISNVTITHNTINGSMYSGINIGNVAGQTIGGINISYNRINNVCTAVADCGAIQLDNRSHGSSPTVINNNVIGNYGSAATRANAIYLDDLLSYATVSNNIVYGTGNYGLLIHAGDHNNISNNIFDISQATGLAVYSNWNYTAYTMSNNSFNCNIVYASTTPPLSLWNKVGTAQNPSVTQNLYWDPLSRLPNLGAIVDASPTFANPGFSNPGAGNYNLAWGHGPSGCGFTPISTASVGPLTNS